MTTKRVRVYIAGPLTLGDVQDNVKKACEVYVYLIRQFKFIPFCPHLSQVCADDTSLQQLDYDAWLEHDFDWIDVCDCLLRLPGESPGAQKEIAYAKALGIPVFYSVDAMEKYYSEDIK